MTDEPLRYCFTPEELQRYARYFALSMNYEDPEKFYLLLGQLIHFASELPNYHLRENQNTNA